jgi:hypothetical protein
MPKGLKRYYGLGHLHFLTFSCYRRLPLLRTNKTRNVFVQALAKMRERYGFLDGWGIEFSLLWLAATVRAEYATAIMAPKPSARDTRVPHPLRCKGAGVRPRRNPVVRYYGGGHLHFPSSWSYYEKGQKGLIAIDSVEDETTRK